MLLSSADADTGRFFQTEDLLNKEINLDAFQPIMLESVKFWDVSKKTTAKNTKAGVNLSNTGSALRKLHPEHIYKWEKRIKYEI